MGKPYEVVLVHDSSPHMMEVTFASSEEMEAFQPEFERRRPKKHVVVDCEGVKCEVHCPAGSLTSVKLAITATLQALDLKATIRELLWTQVYAQYESSTYPTPKERAALVRAVEAIDRRVTIHAFFSDASYFLEVARSGPPTSPVRFLSRVAKVVND
jgi:hypothetical protein